MLLRGPPWTVDRFTELLAVANAANAAKAESRISSTTLTVVVVVPAGS